MLTFRAVSPAWLVVHPGPVILPSRFLSGGLAFAAFGAGLLMTSCATPPSRSVSQQVGSAGEIQAGTQIETDPDTKTTKIVAPFVRAESPGGWRTGADVWWEGLWGLRGWAKAGVMLDDCQLYVSCFFRKSFLLASAHDRDGATLAVLQIDQRVTSRGYLIKTVGVIMPRAYLEAHKASGIDVIIEGQREDVKFGISRANSSSPGLAAVPGTDLRIESRRGDVQLTIPAAYVVGFLASLQTAPVGPPTRERRSDQRDAPSVLASLPALHPRSKL